MAGQQFEYSYDDIGNRTSGKTGGDTAGANLRTTTDTTDAEGRLSQRTNPRQYEVQGAAQVGTDVRVNGVVATRQGEYFRFEGTAGVAAAQWLDTAVTLNGASLISGRKKYVPPQTEAMLHDVAGNRIQDGRWEMRWDNENRLIDVRTLPAAATAGVPNQRLRYTYDADGRLIERRRFSWVSGAWSLEETTRYLNDGLQCVAEFNASNALLRRQVWGLDLDGSRGGLGGIGGLLWIVSTANGTHYAAPDGSGNVVALFGTSGTETARYEYGPFGELLRMSGTAIAAENPWRFSSKRQDPTTDWVHYEFRVYDPSSGRWLSRDPIGEAGGENLYGFVGNDPVNRVDLFGLCEGCAEEHPIQAATQAPAAEKSWFAEHVGPIIGPPYIAIVGPLLGAVSYVAENGVHLVTQTLYGDDYQWGANSYDRNSNVELLKLERNGPVNYRDANGEQQLFSHMVVGVFCTAAMGFAEAGIPVLGMAMELVEGATLAAHLADGIADLAQSTRLGRKGLELAGDACEFAAGVARKSGKAVNKTAKRPVRAAKAAPEIYKASLRTKMTPRNTSQDLYEIANTGPKNYLLEGGGTQFWADGVVGTTIQEAKFVINAKSSPFISGSSAPNFIRQKIVAAVDDEFARMARIIADPGNPLSEVEVIVSDPAANRFFIDMLSKHGLNGRVINR